MSGVRRPRPAVLAVALAAAGACGGGPEAARPSDAGVACARVGPAAPEPVGRFRLTQYWVADERYYQGEGDLTPLCDRDGTMLSLVPASFAESCKRQGTCRLTDGRLLNAWSACDCPGGMCFVSLNHRRYPWGKGTRGRRLDPFRSIAADPRWIPTGTRVYLPELRGLRLPTGGVHDGCLFADDVGGGVRGFQIDLFVGQRRWWNAVRRSLPPEVTVYVDPPECAGAI